ncbi:RHS repeat protein [Sulfidibacter corallicola]|uniref:RHS repeat protein n=1 Tax=Sulfidibacter corallicola TaxID=2818388 RepID=A0A8A4TYU1_SULCO|nr:RHS repeat-associated core domain-containing protein [Sulfidibacter corallicola]QTD54264.1 RHS repeat protein [Sulfidibacter corallicola]
MKSIFRLFASPISLVQLFPRGIAALPFGDARPSRPWKRSAAWLAILAVGAWVPMAARGQVSVELTDDTYIDSNAPDSTHGSDVSMFIFDDDAGGGTVVLLRFTNSLGGGVSVTSAELQLDVLDCGGGVGCGAGAEVQIRAVDANATWNEATVSFNTRPALDDQIAAVNGTMAASGLEDTFDVTSIIQAMVSEGRSSFDLQISAASGPGRSGKRITSQDWKTKESGTRGRLLIDTVVSTLTGAPPTQEARGVFDNITWDTAEPISVGGGEFRHRWQLLHPGGIMNLAFTMSYAPDMETRTPFNTGRQMFPPADGVRAFQSNAVMRLIEVRDTSVEPAVRFVNMMLYDNLFVFEPQGKGGFRATGPIRFELRKLNDGFYVMAPDNELVYIFRKSGGDIDQPGRTLVWMGEVAYILDRNGNRLSFTYNDDHLPTKIDDGMGRELNFTYNDSVDREERHLMQVDDGAGRTITFHYDTCNGGAGTKLSGFTDARGQMTTFAYTGTGEEDCYLLQSFTKPRGNSPIDQDWTTNPSGIHAIQAQRDPFDNETTFSYTPGARGTSEVAVTYPDSSQRQFQHERDRFPTTSTNDVGSTIDLVYNSDFQPTSFSNRADDVSSLTYEPNSGKKAAFTNAEGHTQTDSYTAQPQTFTHPDNSDTVDFTFQNRTRRDYADGSFETFAYDANGNLTSRTDRGGFQWTFQYNGRGQLTRLANPLGGNRDYTYANDGTLSTYTDSDVGVTTYNYDTFKRMTRSDLPGGDQVSYAYDAEDHLTSFTDENDETYTYGYDANGVLTQITDPASMVTTYGIDALDRIASITDRLGKTTTITFDSMGRTASTTDANGITTSYSYDSRGWATDTTSGGQTFSSTYDAHGRPLTITSPLGRTKAYAYNRVGQLTGITDELNRTTTVARDPMGRIGSITDPLTRTKSYSYDPRGMLSEVTTPLGSRAQYSYDGMQQLDELTDLNGNVWDRDVTTMGRAAVDTDPLGNGTQYGYDERGRQETVTYPDSRTLQRTFDGRGRVTREQYTDGTDLNFTYDALGRMLTTDDLTLTWDAEGRVTSSTDDRGILFGASYDDGGRLASISYDDGLFTVTYTYDPVTELVTQVSDSLTNTTLDLTYDNDFRLVGVTRPNGVNTTLEWDAASRMSRIRHGSIVDRRYTRDAAGQITGIEVDEPLTPGLQGFEGTEDFSYDSAAQVTSDGYAYDLRGRQTTRRGTAQVWDDAGRLASIGTITFNYNGIGELVSRTESGVTRRFYRNYGIRLDPIVAERDDNAQQFVRFYVWTPDGDLLYAIDPIDGNAVSHYHFDATGSTIALTDAAGAVTDAYAYAPYGRVVARQGASTQPFTFVGEKGVRREGEHLYHMRARFYDSVTARFLSRDPAPPDLQRPITLNPYQYAFDNPISHIDPTGNDAAASNTEINRNPQTNTELMDSLKQVVATDVEVRNRGHDTNDYGWNPFYSAGSKRNYAMIDTFGFDEVQKNKNLSQFLCHGVAEAIVEAINNANIVFNGGPVVASQIKRSGYVTATHWAVIVSWRDASNTKVGLGYKRHTVIIDLHATLDVNNPKIQTEQQWGPNTEGEGGVSFHMRDALLEDVLFDKAQREKASTDN